MQTKTIKQKSCKICKTKFTPYSTTTLVCSHQCAITYANNKRIRLEVIASAQERVKIKIARDSIKTKQEWLKEAQQWVNKYVRLRDKNLGCISCDKAASWHGQWHGSHFRSTKAASAVRFNLWNINKSCSVCNNWLSGNIGEYEPRLRLKIGNEKVDWLKCQNHTVNYSIDYLKRLKGIAKKKCAMLEKRIKLLND